MILHGFSTGSRSSRTVPIWVLFNGVHPSGVNYSNMGSPHTADPVRSPAPAWTPFHGLYSSSPGSAPVGSLHWPQLPSGQPALPWAAVWRCAPPWYHPWVAGGQPAPQASGNFCSSNWSTSFHFFFTDLGVCRVVSLSSFSQMLLCIIFFSPLLNMLSLRCYQCRSLAQLFLGVDPFWSHLPLELSFMGQLLGSFHKGPAAPLLPNSYSQPPNQCPSHP